MRELMVMYEEGVYYKRDAVAIFGGGYGDACNHFLTPMVVVCYQRVVCKRLKTVASEYKSA